MKFEPNGNLDSSHYILVENTLSNKGKKFYSGADRSVEAMEAVDILNLTNAQFIYTLVTREEALEIPSIKARYESYKNS